MLNDVYIDCKSKLATYDLSSLILSRYSKNVPIVVCLGCENVLSDMVGVFVADILKSKNIKLVVFGGSNHNVNKDIAKMLYNKIANHRLLFIDSGLITQKNSIMFSNQTILNDGTKLDSPSISSSTIQLINGKVNLSRVSYKKVLEYANIIADSICDYYSYINLLTNNKRDVLC